MIPFYFSLRRVEGVRLLEAWDKGVKALDGLGSWLLGIPQRLFVLFIGAVWVPKATFTWKTPNVEGAAPLFPHVSSSSDMLVGVGVVKLIQGSSWGYLIVTLAALVAALVIVGELDAPPKHRSAPGWAGRKSKLRGSCKGYWSGLYMASDEASSGSSRHVEGPERDDSI